MLALLLLDQLRSHAASPASMVFLMSRLLHTLVAAAFRVRSLRERERVEQRCGSCVLASPADPSINALSQRCSHWASRVRGM
jgi:hypothetical protein